MEQMEANDFARNQEITKQNQKNEKIEDNVKYLIGKTTDLQIDPQFKNYETT